MEFFARFAVKAAAFYIFAKHLRHWTLIDHGIDNDLCILNTTNQWKLILT